MNRDLLLGLMLAGTPILANGEALNTFNGIVQDDIERAKGCGTGCVHRQYQLTDHEETEKGWRRLKVMSATYVFNYQTGEYEPYGTRRGLVKEPENISIFWLFADCKEKKIAFGTNADPSRITRSYGIYSSAEVPLTDTASYGIYNDWSALCSTKKTTTKFQWDDTSKRLLNYYKGLVQEEAKN